MKSNSKNKLVNMRLDMRIQPTVAGVGCVGIGKYKPTSNGVTTPAYSVWSAMINKSYNVNDSRYRKAVVSKDWLNYQRFAAWYEANFEEGKIVVIQPNLNDNSLYSRYTCAFMSSDEYNTLLISKHYKFLSPDGDIVPVNNLNLFCSKFGLDQGAMTNVSKGKLPHHKQWKRYINNDDSLYGGIK